MADSSVDDIRARMARIRSRAHYKASRLGEETRQFLDWKNYVRLFPWGTLAIAAGLGYWLVPKRKAVTASDAKAIAGLAKSGRIQVGTPPAPPPKKTIIGGLAALAGGIALKAATSYAQHYAQQYLTRMMSQSMPGMPGHPGHQRPVPVPSHAAVAQHSTPYPSPYTSQEYPTYEPAGPLA
ncbi:MAG: hypothetical protein IT428_31565 [Planctomycetaceae bacterium]|nr:hypothetical protein [Planctomycetaceae bacterium]